MVLAIKWNKRAVDQLIKAIEYIQEGSVQNSEKVKSDILSTIASLVKHPEKSPLDKYRSNNDGSFRAFEIHRYRISYRIKNNEIRIIRIRHTKRNPLNY